MFMTGDGNPTVPKPLIDNKLTAPSVIQETPLLDSYTDSFGNTQTFQITAIGSGPSRAQSISASVPCSTPPKDSKPSKA